MIALDFVITLVIFAMSAWVAGYIIDKMIVRAYERGAEAAAAVIANHINDHDLFIDILVSKGINSKEVRYVKKGEKVKVDLKGYTVIDR